MNNRSISSMHAERKINVHSHKHSLIPYPSLSPYRQTHRHTDGWRNKYTCCAWAGRTESLFVIERKFIRVLHNTSLKFNIRVKIL
jgi:hypothetical protein